MLKIFGPYSDGLIEGQGAPFPLDRPFKIVTFSYRHSIHVNPNNNMNGSVQ